MNPLPDTYEAAVVAIAQSDRIDQCQSWANVAAERAAALLGRDAVMVNAWRRVQARALRRAGELLAACQRDQQAGAGRITQREAAMMAGLSEHQELIARRLAMIPEHEFEAAIGAPTVPAINVLRRRLPRIPNPHNPQRQGPRPIRPAPEPAPAPATPGRRTKADRAARLETIRTLAGEGSTSIQIAADVGLGPEHVRALLKRHGIDCLADRTVGRARLIDPNRVMDHLVESLADIQTDAPMINPAALDAGRVPEWIASLALSHRALGMFLGRLKRSVYGTTQAHPAHLENPPGADQADVDGAGTRNATAVYPGTWRRTSQGS